MLPPGLPRTHVLKRKVCMDYLKAFITGGLLCVIGQILIDKTKLTPARILVTFVTAASCSQRWVFTPRL